MKDVGKHLSDELQIRNKEVKKNELNSNSNTCVPKEIAMHDKKVDEVLDYCERNGVSNDSDAKEEIEGAT